MTHALRVLVFLLRDSASRCFPVADGPGQILYGRMRDGVALSNFGH